MASLPFVPVSIVQESLKFLVLGTILTSFLIPTAIMLFAFSTPRLRRQPAFVFNVLAILLGLVQGAINFVNATGPMLNRPEISAANSTLGISLSILVPLCVERVLILRVLSIYPPRLLPRAKCLAIYGPIVLTQIARLANAASFISSLLDGPHNQNALSFAESVWHLPNAKVEWFLQLFDDTYVSGLFLSRLYAGMRELARSQALIQKCTRTRGPSSYFERLKTLFWIATSNFVFPVILNVVEVVLILRDADFEHGTLVLMVNNYITIIGVLLATIWASGSESDERESARWMRITESTGEKSAGRSRSAPPRGMLLPSSIA